VGIDCGHLEPPLDSPIVAVDPADSIVPKPDLAADFPQSGAVIAPMQHGTSGATLLIEKGGSDEADTDLP
jgi:hypothetical protein